MTWKDVGKAIGKAAPVLGSVVGGPAGGAIGEAISALLGVENKPDKVAEALKTNPEAFVKLKQYEMQHQEELQKLQLENVKTYLQDLQNARARQVEHEKATGKTDINLYVLAWSIVIGFFVLIGVMMFVAIPSESNNIIYMLFGTLSAGFGSVMQYFFGSSRGSNEKTKILARSINTNIAPVKEEVMDAS